MSKIRKVICMDGVPYSLGDCMGNEVEREITSMAESPDGDIIVWVKGMSYPYMKIKEHSVNRIFYE